MPVVPARDRIICAVFACLWAFAPTAGAVPVQIEAGFASSMALREDGTVFVFGEGARGDSTTYALPELAPGPGNVGVMDHIVAIATHTAYYALHEDGTVFAWGQSDYFGQLGDGERNDSVDGVPDRVKGPAGVGDLTNVIAIAGGHTHALAVRSDGTVWSWGTDRNGCLGQPGVTATSVPVQVVGPGGTGVLGNIRAVAAGYALSVALANDGTVWAWGDNGSGQLGDGTFNSSGTPVAVLAPTGTARLSDVAHVSAGDQHVLARRGDGTAWAWGGGTVGQLGNGVKQGDPGFPDSRRNRPVQVLGPSGVGFLTNVVSLSGHDEHSAAVLGDGSAWAWGDGDHGQLGQGDTTDSSLPLRIKGSGGAGLLTGAALIAAGGQAGHTLVVMTDGTVRGVGSNFYYQTGSASPDPEPQGDQLFVSTACGLRLKEPFAVSLGCPSGSVIAGTEYTVSWGGLGAGAFRLEIDGVEQITTDQSITLSEPDTLRFARFRTFRARLDDGCGESAWTQPCQVTIIPACTAPPASGPVVSCPERALAGEPFVIGFTALTGTNDAKRYQLDANGDDAPDAETPDATTLSFAWMDSGYGQHAYRVRGVNACGEGPWSEPCLVNVRPNTSQCFTVGAISVCSSGFVENPPGTFTATSDYIRLGDPSQEFGVVVDGSVSGTPGTGALAFEGRMFLDTDIGPIDLFSYADPGHGILPGSGAGTHGTDESASESELSPTLPGRAPGMSPAIHVPRHSLPSGLGGWTPPTNAAGLVRLITGLPCARPNLFPPGFTIGCLPFNGQLTLSLQLFSSCLSGNATFGMDDVPENPGFQFGASFQLCPSAPYISGVTADVVELRLAGCELRALNGTLTDRPVGSGNMGVHLDTATLRCPIVGGLSSQIDDVFVTTGDFTFATGSVDVPNLDLVLLSLENGRADILRRSPESLGYRICGSGELGVLASTLGVDFGFTLLDGDVQKACANPTALKKVTRLLPRWPLWIDRIGGCYTLDFPTMQPGEECKSSDAFEITTPCVTCDLGTTFQLHASGHAGSPLPWFDGDLVTISPGEVTIGDGLSLGGTVKLIGKRVGTGQACVTSSSAEVCTDISLGGVITGSAILGVNSKGLGGRATLTIDIPKFDVFCPACVGIDPPAVGASVFLGEFEDDVPFAGKKKHYGVTTSVSVGPFKGIVGIDVRYLSPHFIGVRNLGPFAGARAFAILPEDVDGSQAYMVPAGETQIVFGASSPDGLPMIELMTPGGGTISADTNPELMMQDAERGSTVFVLQDPDPGPWTVLASGLPDGATITFVGIGDAVPATVEVTSPAAPTADRVVTWNATVPVQAAATTLSLYASENPDSAAGASGRLLHQRALAAGPGMFEIPEGELPEGTWHVAALLDDGIGQVSATLAAGTIVVVDDEAPAPPASILLAALPDGVRITWTASPSPDVASYEVLVRDEAEPGSQVVLRAGLDLVRDVGLSGAGARRFLLRATDASGNVGEPADGGTSEPDAEADGTGPAAPEGLVVQRVGTTALTATWTDDADAASWRLYYGLRAGHRGRQAVEGESPVASAGAMASLNGFVSGQRIFVAVSGVDAAGNEGTLSPWVSVLLSDGTSVDGDALADDWEQLFFASLEATDGMGDADLDALSDAAEHELGRDPLLFDPYSWGDLAPRGSPDGQVDIADVIRVLRFAVALETPSAEELRRADVMPATIEGDLLRPVGMEPRLVTIADVVMVLRAAVGLTSFASTE